MDFWDEHRRSKRIFIFVVLGLFCMLVLWGRLFYMQIIQGEIYQNLAEKNRVALQFSPSMRGEIFDRHGSILAFNRKNYRLFLIPKFVKNIDKSLDFLSLFVEISPSEKQRILRFYEKAGKRSMVPILVHKYLNHTQILTLEMALQEEIGAQIRDVYSREYPLKEAASHVLGYLGTPSLAQEEERKLSKLGRVNVGKTALEAFYEKSLFGNPGVEEIEMNASGQLIKVLSRTPAEDGKILLTTLDSSLQTFVYDLLKPHKSASAVVMRNDTGEILALVSAPGFDPAAFEDGILESLWKDLLENPYHPLTNKASGGLYAPGSCFKMIVALAALEMGISPESSEICTGGTVLGDHIFHCHREHGFVEMKSALVKSCDVYFYNLGLRVGIEKIAQMAKKFGFGEKSDLNFPGEKAGLLPSKTWKESVKKESWRPYDTILSSIGQGYILSTPLQLAQMTARIASGKKISPKIVVLEREEQRQEQGQAFENLDIQQENLRLIRDSLYDVVNSPFGTCYFSKIDAPCYCGKTGTSQVKRITMKERSLGLHKLNTVPWHFKDHAIFAGYGPAINPLYTVVVVVEHGGSGSVTAAPIASKIFREIFEKHLR